MTPPEQRERILKKAYEIWEAEGRVGGRDMEHWLKAELLIAAEAAKAKPKPKAKAPAKKTTRKTSAKPKS